MEHKLPTYNIYVALTYYIIIGQWYIVYITKVLFSKYHYIKRICY